MGNTITDNSPGENKEELRIIPKDNDKLLIRYSNILGRDTEVIIDKSAIIEKNNVVVKNIENRDDTTICLDFYNDDRCRMGVRDKDEKFNNIKIGSVISFKCFYDNWYNRIIGEIKISEGFIDEFNNKKLTKPISTEQIFKIYQLEEQVNSYKFKVYHCKDQINKYTDLAQGYDTAFILSELFIDKDTILTPKQNCNNNNYTEKLNELQTELETLTTQLNISWKEFKILIESVKDDWTYF